METIGVNDTYVQKFSGRLWNVKRVTPDTITLSDPYEAKREQSFPNGIFRKAVDAGVFTLAWTAKESKKWR